MEGQVISDPYYPSESFIHWNDEQIQGRSPLLYRGSNKEVVDGSNSKHQQHQEDRLFLPGYSTKTYSNFNLLSLLRTSTLTTTVLSTVTSTLTSVTVQTCAASAQFIATTACRRRRYAKIFKELMNDRSVAITVFPSKVQSLVIYILFIFLIHFPFHFKLLFLIRMEVSEAPPHIRQVRRDWSEPTSPSTEIKSSQQTNADDDDYEENYHRQKRSFFNKYVVVTSSSILRVTSYLISASTVTKSITLGIGNCMKCVSCVPSGVTIC